MEILVQSQIPISRPDDFFAEMLKSDQQMAKVKSRLLSQQQKIQTFEERKQRLENKKFHKAIKAYKQHERHSEKRENVNQINRLKKKIHEKGDIEEKEFNQIFNKEDKQKGRHHGKGKVIDNVKQQHKQNMQKRNKQIKKGGKRPGKVARSKNKQRKRR